MSHSFTYTSQSFFLERYPKTTNTSLLPYSNAELLVLDYLKTKQFKTVHLFNDRFGVWNCALHQKKVFSICNYESHKKSVIKNLELNKIICNQEFYTSLDTLKPVEVGLIKIPKSLELFELFLQQIHKASSSKTEVVCGFMTKYFTSSLLKISKYYFDDVSQTKAWKKSRLLILKAPKKINIYKELLNSILWRDQILYQYYGVFSSTKIDIGTQFLLNNLVVQPNEIRVLDLASGNGILAKEVLSKNKDTIVSLVDDSQLAVESSKLNLPKDKSVFYCNDNLEDFHKDQFDLVLSNPPFHFEYENNIEVTLSLFEQVFNILKPQGRFLLVANSHLNYTIHLSKKFSKVSILNENTKFQIIECVR